jgi:hypothetical protein
MRASELLDILKENQKANRLIAQFILIYQKELFWSHLDMFDIAQLVDLLWYIPKENIDFDIVNSNQTLKEIYCANGYIEMDADDDISSDDFDLSVLIELNKTNNLKADLSFEYLCDNCKHSFPMSFDRCPNCHAILSTKIQKSLMKVHDENNYSLL